ncbi:hypothetical protein M6D81_25825 [Paenibacillus sp. J5C_2022]|uniref:hypothetical protein n=1 Tax=Paenibacillus sp. J5C2022 TaxID=2977129 RepID=UPI0021D3BA55|nr:hypothetical protein [Paenibacillus sp. J5C2022]MCU6712123.1 hypothetical protein [Paenibacillus sp. J5C2022]
MSYQEQRSIATMITALLITGAYGVYVYGKLQTGAIADDDMRFWAGTMLMFIGIGIVVAIAVQLIFHMLLSVAVAVREKTRNGKCDDNEMQKTIESEMVTDERDKLIELKAVKVGFIVVGIGFVAALASQVLHQSSAVMINIMFVSFFAGSMVGSLTQFYLYRKGVTNG